MSVLMESNMDVRDEGVIGDDEDLAQVKKLELQAAETLSVFEATWPKTVLCSVLHNLLHFPRCVYRWNNVRNFWAFFNERCLHSNFIAVYILFLISIYTIYNQYIYSS